MGEDHIEEELLDEYKDNIKQLSAVKQYFNTVNKYQVLDDDEIMNLVKKYQATQDVNIRNKIIMHNQRLVLKIALSIKKSSSYDFFDRIQEANVLFIKYLDNYNPSQDVKLSTYIYKCIKYGLKREISDKSDMVKITSNNKLYYYKYKSYKENYINTHHKLPSEEEIMKYLSIPKSTLKTVLSIEQYFNSITSLDTPLQEDDDKTSIGDMVPSVNNSISFYQNNSDEKLLLYQLKNSLDDYEYYLVFNEILYKGNTDLSLLLNMEKKSIKKDLAKVLKKIKNKHILDSEPTITPLELSKIDLNPINFSKKVILLYLKSLLSEDEYCFIYYSWYKKLEPSLVKEKLKINNVDYDKMNEYIVGMYSNLLNINIDTYKNIVDRVKRKYSLEQIFKADIRPNNINYVRINALIKELSYEDIMEVIEENSISLGNRQQRLIDEYFNDNFESIDYSILDTAKRNITLKTLGYIGNRHLPLDKLYKSYIEHKSIFDTERQEYLEGTLFSKYTHKKSKYNTKLAKNTEVTILRLEQLYYNIDNFFTIEMSLFTVKNILKQYEYVFSKMEYDIVTKKKFNDDKNVNAMLCKKYGLDAISLRNIYGHAIDKIENLYLGLYNEMLLDDDKHYLKYIEDESFPLSDENREVCRLRYNNKMDYKQIMLKMNLKTPQRVSNIIKRAEKLIDMHYYNVINEIRYEEDFVRKLIEMKYNSEPEHSIITNLFIKKTPRKELYEKYGVKTIKNLFNIFHHHYIRIFSDKELEQKDIEKEVLCHDTDTVLNERERQVISLVYGIKSKYNIEGKKYTPKEISQLLNIETQNIKNLIKEAIITIGARKNNIIGPDLGRISREELIEFLKDKNIPLTEEEIQLLKELKGIGLKTLSLKELSEKYKINEASVRRRIYLSFLSLLKYQDNKKKNRKLDYETNVLPLIKYFPTFERNILISIYRDKKTESEIAQMYQTNVGQMRNHIFKVKKKLYYYMKNKKAKKFDFDYARKVLYEKDLPFYGDINIARTYFIKYFGEDNNIPKRRNELVKELNLYDDFKTHNLLKQFMISILMYKDNYKKIKTFSKKEVELFYQNNKHKYKTNERKIFEREMSKEYNSISNIKELNRFIVMELLRDKGIQQLNLDEYPEDKRISFIKNNPYDLTNNQLEMVRRYYKIPRKVFMSGENKRKLYKMLSSIINELDKRKKRYIKIGKS